MRPARSPSVRHRAARHRAARRTRALLALTGLVAPLLPVLAAPAAATSTTATADTSLAYEVVDLGLPPSAQYSWDPAALNDEGVIAGTARSDGSARVVTWRDGVYTDRGEGRAEDLDEAGTVVGTRIVTSGDETYQRAWRWPAWGGDEALGTQNGDELAESVATGINRHGQVVGWWESSVYPHERSAYVWTEANGMQPLAGYTDEWGAASSWTEAHGINDGGRIAGHVSTRNMDRRPAFWTLDGVTVSPDLRWPARLQEDGSIAAGWVADPRTQVETGAVWKDGSVTPFTLPAGAVSARGMVRGDDGSWIGSASYDSWTSRPVMWLDGPTGPAVPLQDLVQTPGWTIHTVHDMNDDGWILATGQNGSAWARVLLKPATARPSIVATAVEHRDVPTGNWVAVPQSGTVDGNVVRISADVHNPGTDPLEVEVALLREGVDVADPADAVIPAGQTRRVSLDWDTTGAAWNGELPAGPHELEIVLVTGQAEETDSETTTFAVRPRPVFLVHGFNADASTWERYPGFLHAVNPAWPVYAIGDGQAAGAMNTGSLTAPDTAANTLSVNAMIMDGYVDQVRAELDAQFFDVVAHSMGGLISRAYVSTHLPEAADGRAAMNQLVMLGTPNHGSPCASLMRLHGMWELRPEVVAEYNGRWTNPRGVPMSVLAGDPLTRTCQSPVEGDGVVEVPSAVFGFTHRGQTGNIHTALTGQEDFSSWVLPLLVRELGTAPGAPAATLAAADEQTPSAPSPQLLTTATVAVPAGEAVDVALEPGDAEAFGATLAAVGDVSGELLDPSGNVVAQTGAEDGPFRTVSVDRPASGGWTLRLSAPTAVQVPVSAWVQGSPLDLSLRPVRGDRGRAELTVDLIRSGSPVTGAQVVAELSAAGQEPVTLPLTAAGEGAYAGSSAPLSEGRYLVTVSAATTGGSRTTLGSVTVSGEADDVAPTTTAAVDGAPVTGWYRDAVEVELTATDDGAGVQEVRYRVGDGDEQVVKGDRATVPVTAEGTTRVAFWAVDRAGNAEAASSIEVRLDRTAPTLACTATPGTLWAPNHKLVQVEVSCATADSGSGAGQALLVEATSSEPDDGPGDSDGATTGDLDGWTVGAADTSGQARAERDGSGTGRSYDLRYRVTDAAGNVAEATASVLVPVEALRPGKP